MPLTYNPSVMNMDGTMQRRGNWGVKILLEAASGDFEAGEVVIMSSDNVTQSHTAPGADTYSAALASGVRIAGVACKKASGTTSAAIPIWVPLDSTAQMLLRIGSTGTGANQEVQDVALGDLATCIRYQGTAATGSHLRTTIGPAPGGSGTDFFVVQEKYDYKLNGGNSGNQSAGDDYGLVWVSFVMDNTVFGRSTVP